MGNYGTLPYITLVMASGEEARELTALPRYPPSNKEVNRSTYKLDAIGIVGPYEGDRAVDALETIHL